jgi:hypothetical protein
VHFASGEDLSNTDIGAPEGVHPAIPSQHEDITDTMRDPLEDDPPITESILSPVSVCSDLDSFSVVSYAEGSRMPPPTEDTEELISCEVLDPPANASDCLTSLVQRYHSLCCTISTLRNDINKQATAMNADALEKFEDAKMRLETSRGKAREVVESMREVSGSNVSVRLPWVHLDNRSVFHTHRNYTKLLNRWRIIQGNPFRL